MADIARLAGVSVATVSRALSGSSLINEETRARIVELARSLNYAVNVGAQNLRRKQNRTLAVVVPFDPVSHERLSDPFFLGLIGGIADAAIEGGHDLLLSRVPSDRLDLAAQLLDTGRAAGVVLIGQWHHHDQLNAMAVRQLPFVVWGAQMARQLYTTVGTDNVRGGRLATEHLLALGARDIAFYGDPELPEVGQRHEGYRQALLARGIEPASDLTRAVPFDTERIRHDLETLLQSGRRVDGIVASSDVAAMTIIGTLRRAGRRVPQDVAVVGYDDIPLAAHFDPALTTVRQPLDAAGKSLVQALLVQLAGQPAASVLLPTELVLRESAPAVPAAHESPAREYVQPRAAATRR